MRPLLWDRRPNILLVLTSLFVRYWCVLPCAPACVIHCSDILLLTTGVFSIPMQWILLEGHKPSDVGCLMFFLVSIIENASSCGELLCGTWLSYQPCWCYPVASNAEIVAGMHGSLAS